MVAKLPNVWRLVGMKKQPSSKHDSAWSQIDLFEVLGLDCRGRRDRLQPIQKWLSDIMANRPHTKEEMVRLAVDLFALLATADETDFLIPESHQRVLARAIAWTGSEGAPEKLASEAVAEARHREWLVQRSVHKTTFPNGILNYYSGAGLQLTILGETVVAPDILQNYKAFLGRPGGIPATDADEEWLPRYRQMTMREIERCTEICTSTLSEEYKEKHFGNDPVIRMFGRTTYVLRTWLEANSRTDDKKQ